MLNVSCTMRILPALMLLLLMPVIGLAEYSTVIEVEGQACMGDDKSRRDTEREALQQVQRTAVEHSQTWLRSETTVQNMILEKDLIEAFARATVTILEELEKAWFTDARTGDCFRIRVRAEVVPKLPESPESKDVPDSGQSTELNPRGPLDVRLWTSQEVYREGERMRIYVQGNKPFYAVIHYHDANGGILQLLPNAHRAEHYFNGSVIYEIPSGRDAFDLIVTPPYGTETIRLYAATSPLGPLTLKNLGPVYAVENQGTEIAKLTRGVAIVLKEPGNPSEIAAAEFVERHQEVNTQP